MKSKFTHSVFTNPRFYRSTTNRCIIYSDWNSLPITYLLSSKVCYCTEVKDFRHLGIGPGTTLYKFLSMMEIKLLWNSEESDILIICSFYLICIALHSTCYRQFHIRLTTTYKDVTKCYMLKDYLTRFSICIPYNYSIVSTRRMTWQFSHEESILFYLETTI